MSTHTIYEHGQGFPDVGDRVYCSETNTVHTVESIDSHILTRQGTANRMLVTLAYDCDPSDLDEGEFEAIIDLRIKVGIDGERRD
jgi:hypothetical protein